MRKAFLLAAGLGKRLRPLTKETPKCLLPIKNKPLLQIWIEHLIKNKINEILINTHWHAEKVTKFVYNLERSHGIAVGNAKDYIVNRKTQGPKILLFHEEILLGSAGTILANIDWVSDNNPFFIIYADNYTNINLDKMWENHINKSYNFSLGVFETKYPSKCGILEVKNGVVKSFIEKPKNPKSNLAAAGIYIMNSNLFRLLSSTDIKKEPLDLSFDIFPSLIKEMMIYKINEKILDTIKSYSISQDLEF